VLNRIVEHRIVDPVRVEADIRKLVRDVFELIVVPIIDEPVIVELLTRKLFKLLSDIMEETVRVDVIATVFVEMVEPVKVE
jgi:hypothetical protein